MENHQLAENLRLPIVEEMVPDGLLFGANYMVEFDPHSLWHETSLTIAAHALKHGIRTEYHTFMHTPSAIRHSLNRLGLSVHQLEQEEKLRIIDTYTVTTRIGTPNPLEGLRRDSKHFYERYQSVDIKAWGEGVERGIAEGVVENEKRWLHIDDNTSILLQYNDEKSILEAWRTRTLLYVRARELAQLNAFLTGVVSDSFYRQFESFCDGIIDFQSREEAGQIQHFVRVRTIRGTNVDTRWRRLLLRENGEVVFYPESIGPQELGIRRWIKGKRN